MFRRKARRPLPARARRREVDGRGRSSVDVVDVVGRRGVDVRQEEKEVSSPERWE